METLPTVLPVVRTTKSRKDALVSSLPENAQDSLCCVLAVADRDGTSRCLYRTHLYLHFAQKEGGGRMWELQPVSVVPTATRATRASKYRCLTNLKFFEYVQFSTQRICLDRSLLAGQMSFQGGGLQKSTESRVSTACTTTAKCLVGACLTCVRIPAAATLNTHTHIHWSDS